MTAILPTLACFSCNSLNNISKIGNNSATVASNPWEDKAKQDQVYACHVFVAAGLVEAEYFRATGKKINLSEADLFLKHIKEGAPSWDAALSLYFARGVNMKNTRDLEIGHVHKSFDLIQKYGIATAREIPYARAARIGIPFTMSRLRENVAVIKKGMEAGGSQTELTVKAIAQIKKDGVLKVLAKESKYFSSRQAIKQFASQYTLKSKIIHNKSHSIALLKRMLAEQKKLGLNYLVPSKDNPLKDSGLVHTLIVTGFDEKKKVFTTRDSDSKGLFGKYALTEDFILKFATKIYYLEKR